MNMALIQTFKVRQLDPKVNRGWVCHYPTEFITNYNFLFYFFFQLRLEYFIAVAVAVIVILILVLIVVAVLLVRVCKHRAIGSSSSFSDKITSVNGSMTALQSPYGAQVAGKDTLN